MGVEVRDPEFARLIQRQVDALSKRTIYHTLELGDGRTIEGVIGVDALRRRLEAFPVPADLTGRRVLDVGAASGWNSFELERRGAEVVAVDCVEYEELPVVKHARHSNVDYRILDVDELTPASVGYFDCTLFFGVLYHLRHPLLGLERICALTRDTAFVESFVSGTDSEQSDACVLEFYEGNELGGQIDNWYGPTVKALLAMCRSAGFVRVKLEYVEDRRAGVTCRRKWEEPPAQPTAPAPWICSAVNNRTQDPYFHPLKDEYISLYFRSEGALAREQLRVEIDGYGVPVLTLSAIGAGEWQADMKTPPGLEPGRHEVRLRTVDSAFGNSFEIHVVGGAGSDGSEPVQFVTPKQATEKAPVWIAAENCSSRMPAFHGYKAEHLCCRFFSAETGLTDAHVLVEIDGVQQDVLVVSHLGEREWQANSRFPRALAPGAHQVRLRTSRSPYSEVREIRYEPGG